MKFYKPLILFLEEDKNISASYLSDRFLIQNIKNCCQILVCSLLYNVGIRSGKICKFYFCKERKFESLQKFFPMWPLKDSPKFTFYNSVEARWCRKCLNHYEIVLEYFEALLNEFSYRFGKEHELQEMFDFLKMEPYNITLRLGYKIVYLKNLKIIYPWKNLPLKYRKKDIFLGYRMYYKSLIFNPYEEYCGTKRDIPEFILDGRNIGEFQTTEIN